MTDDLKANPDTRFGSFAIRTDPMEHIGQTVDVQYYGDHHSLSILASVRLDTVNQIGIGVTVNSLNPSGQFFPWTSIVRLILSP